MKILLTGINGQLGWELHRSLSTLGEVIACDRHQLDLGSEDAIRNTLRRIQPNLIVNPAAYTAVDQAESDQDMAMQINTTAPAILAEEAKRLNAPLLHFSTDYVFDGKADRPYQEGDQTGPINVYGASKLAGEEAIRETGVPHLIFRTSWVYAARGKNFLLTMLKLMQERDSLSIVADQFGAPTWSRTIAEASTQALVQWLNPDNPAFQLQSGTYHLTSSGKTNWYEFAQTILQTSAQLADRRDHVTLSPIPTEEYPVPAARPRNSSLNLSKLEQAFQLRMPDWKLALQHCLRDLECQQQAA